MKYRIIKKPAFEKDCVFFVEAFRRVLLLNGKFSEEKYWRPVPHEALSEHSGINDWAARKFDSFFDAKKTLKKYTDFISKKEEVIEELEL